MYLDHPRSELTLNCFFLSVEDAAVMGVNVPEQIYSDRWRIDLTNICRDIMDLSFFHSCCVQLTAQNRKMQQ